MKMRRFHESNWKYGPFHKLQFGRNNLFQSVLHGGNEPSLLTPSQDLLPRHSGSDSTRLHQDGPKQNKAGGPNPNPGHTTMTSGELQHAKPCQPKAGYTTVSSCLTLFNFPTHCQPLILHQINQTAQRQMLDDGHAVFYVNAAHSE